ncbi:MAG: DegT/DnrJ/EryC1/StrS family aminotransferase [Rhodobacteraceae bacterium]|nr:DegT/DnrJ/EryC1/StrS family aminotransferase [Paracoccaceae bacterium]
MVFRTKQHCKDPTIEFLNLFKRPLSDSIPKYMSETFPGKTIAYCARARTGIHEAIDILGIGQGDHVLVPAFNCGSEIDPILVSKAELTLYPVELTTFINPDEIASRIQENTKAIYIIHYFGFPQPEMARISELAKAKGIPIIEDCALSLFSKTADNNIENGCDFSVYCFYKYYPVIAGGALVSKHPDLANRFTKPFPKNLARKTLVSSILQRLLGDRLSRLLIDRLKKILRGNQHPAQVTKTTSRPDMPADYYFDPIFSHARINSLTKRLLFTYNPLDMVEIRRRNFNLVLKGIKDIEAATPLFQSLPEGVCPLSFPILVSNQQSICNALNDARIDATPWWSGYHSGVDWSDQDAASFLKDNLISLPIHQYLKPEQINYMVETLKNLLQSTQSRAVEFSDRKVA